MEDLIKKYMEKYECSREEAIEIIKDDEETDSMSVGQINAELTPEQREAVKDTTRTSSGKSKNTTKERKADEEKRMIINSLLEAVKQIDSNAEATKIEKEINFTIGENHYSVSLIKHRPKKS